MPAPDATHIGSTSRPASRCRVLGLVAIIAIVSMMMGVVASRFIVSPEDAAARSKAPSASRIAVPVERRELVSRVVTRGELAVSNPFSRSIPPTEGAVVTERPPDAGTAVAEGDLLVEVSERPVFVLSGTVPMYRDVLPGSTGVDVKQLESALQRLGFAPGAVDENFDGSTELALAEFYKARGYPAPDPSPEDLVGLEEARQRVVAAQAAVAEAGGADVAEATVGVRDAERALVAAQSAARTALQGADGAVSTATAAATAARQADDAAAAALAMAQKAGEPAEVLRDLQAAAGSARVDESAAGAFARPLRAVLTTLGTVIGVAALVATLGIARTAGGQLLSRFDELTSTEIVVRPSAKTAVDGGTGLPLQADRRIQRLNGVVASGSYASVDVNNALVRSVPIDDPLGADEIALPVVAASPGLLGAVRGEILAGRWLDPILDERAERVAVLGAGAARRLHIDRVSQQPVVFIGDDAFVVVGLLDDVKRHPDLLSSIIIPEGTAADLYGLGAPDEVIIESSLGATQLIGRQAPQALSPVDPDRLRASVPGSFGDARRGAASDINALFLLLSALSLVVGALGIANITLVSVFERTGEIGLRRALGASRRSIIGQFLLESALLGTVGGVIGASVGVIIVVATAAARSWTPVLDLRLALLAPVLGAAIGLAAGAYPAGRAGAIEPAEALRSGMG